MKRAASKSNGEIQANKADLMGRLQTFVELQGALSGRMNLAGQLGLTYGGERDVYKALGYKKVLTYDDFAKRYYRQDIAKAVIDRPIQFTWKGPVLITEVGQETETELEKAWIELNKKLKIKNNFVRLDKLSNIGEYGVLLLGFDDVRKIEDWLKPAPEKDVELNYIRPLSQGSVEIKNYEKDTKNERFGLVKTYSITIATDDGGSTKTFDVDWSRAIHIIPEPSESNTRGVPALQPIFNRLEDVEKLTGGSAEMFWRGARPGFQFIADKDSTIGKDVENDLINQGDEYENFLRRMLVTTGGKWEPLPSQVSSPIDHLEIQIQMICAEKGIPKRILTGSERGELASSQDLSSWYAIVQTRREEVAEPAIVRPFVDMCIEKGILPGPSTGEYQVQWIDLFAISEKDKAEVGRIRATALREYVQNPLAAAVLPPEGFMQWFLGLNEDQVAEITRMSSEEIQREMDRVAAAGQSSGTIEPGEGGDGE